MRTADCGLQTADCRLHLLAEPVPDGLCHLRIFNMNGNVVLESGEGPLLPGRAGWCEHFGTGSGDVRARAATGRRRSRCGRFSWSDESVPT
ncbi:MAG: hypothetical protein MZV63_56240 [Marinilabiliales bacterium]|nr:hypothetical protein [Marinilabiliales bacterium]